MQFFRCSTNFKLSDIKYSKSSAPQRPGILTIGNFDGMHLGHKELLKYTIVKAQQQQRWVSQVIFFEPQPLEFFLKDQAPSRLMTLTEKLLFLKQLGVDEVYCIRFDRDFADLSAESFVKDYLVGVCQPTEVVVGDDFCFGKNRSGNVALLTKMGNKYGFSVSETTTVVCEKVVGARVSSTRIRHLLALGEFIQAEKLLGRPFSFSGRVVYGQQKGRSIGFPTANIRLKHPVMPLTGVFAVEVLCQSQPDHVFKGVANIGVRPTVAQSQNNTLKPPVWLEVHLFDFTGDLYRQRLVVRIRHKIREERTFKDLTVLQSAIEQDVAVAKAFFRRVE